MIAKPGTNWAEYFSENHIDIFNGCSICVNQFLSGNRFEKTCFALKFTATPPPSFRDKLYEVRQMIVAWNGHM